MKRYDIDVQPDRSYYGQGERFEAFAYESGQGDWVRQEDVEALQALNAEMLEALEDIANTDINGVDDAVLRYIFIAKQHLAKTIVTKSKGER
jgi:hypothetical protein